ncbi:hypothetical protein OF83DRAFT_1180329 [Amylostereum chailletii]|nr:hypothetical protein OF83DRAFT_1180329 [Amylostereum chailletii]
MEKHLPSTEIGKGTYSFYPHGLQHPEIEKLYENVLESVRSARSVLESAKPAADNTVESKASRVVNACLEPAQLVAALLQALGTLYPPCAVVGAILLGVVKIERGRRENDTRIVAVYVELSDFLSEWGRLWQKLDKMPLANLESFMVRIGDTIKTFGAFSEHYHNDKAFISIYKHLLYSERNRQTLEGFFKTIETYRGELLRALLAELLSEKPRTESVVINYVTFRTDNERRAEAYLTSHGGEDAVRRNDESLETFAEYLEPNTRSRNTMSPDALRTGRESWEDAHAQSEAVFNIKFSFSLQQIHRDVEYWGGVIMQQLEDGPHKFIPDEDMSDIWFNPEGKYKGDAWTSSVISKVCYHPAIGDAIDDDASGYISVDEVTTFLQNTPKELGWTNLTGKNPAAPTAKFSSSQTSIHNTFKKILHLQRTSSRSTLITMHYIEGVEDYLQPIASSLYQIFDDLPPVAAAKMDRMREQWRTKVEKRVEKHLREVNYKVDPSSVSAITGDERIEWTFMVLLATLLEHHLEVLGRSELNLADIEAAASELKVVFNIYDDRVCELKRIWRRQRVDLDKQMRYYANGMFEDYYKKFNGGVHSDKARRDEDINSDSEAGTPLRFRARSNKAGSLLTDEDLRSFLLEHGQGQMGQIC